MSAIFLLSVCLTNGPRKYSTCIDPHVEHSHQVWSWYDHPLPSYCVFVCWYVTWPYDVDFDLLTLNSWRTWRVMWPTLPPSLKTLCLSVLGLWVITFPVGYHWQWVRGHCACAESRDPWVGGQKQLHFWNPRHRYACSVCNFGGCMMKIIKVICDNNARPCVKRCISFCACAKSRDLLKCSKWLIAVVLVDVDLPYWTSKVKHIVAFTAIFSNIWLRMRRNGYLWTSGVNLDIAVRFVDHDFQ